MSAGWDVYAILGHDPVLPPRQLGDRSVDRAPFSGH